LLVDYLQIHLFRYPTPRRVSILAKCTRVRWLLDLIPCQSNVYSVHHNSLILLFERTSVTSSDASRLGHSKCTAFLCDTCNVCGAHELCASKPSSQALQMQTAFPRLRRPYSVDGREGRHLDVPHHYCHGCSARVSSPISPHQDHPLRTPLYSAVDPLRPIYERFAQGTFLRRRALLSGSQNVTFSHSTPLLLTILIMGAFDDS
jgi:hypothetical protein